MNNIIKYDNSRSLAYVQSVEKIENKLQLRKELAIKLGLKSISEFIEGRAVVQKDDRRMLLNEKGEFMMDESLTTLEKKTKTDYVNGEKIVKEYFIDGNREIITADKPTSDIIKTNKWIFPPKDGIIIVVDDRKYGNGKRLYTTAGKRIPFPAGREFDHLAVMGLHVVDIYGALSSYYRDSIGYSFDYRDNIKEQLIPVDLSTNYFGFDESRKIRKMYNLYNGCGYTLMTPNGEFLKTELGHYYANTKQGFDLSHGLYPTINPSFSTVFYDEGDYAEVERPIFYMVNKEGKAFRDEFGSIVYTDDPFRINNFDEDSITVIQIDPKVRSPDQKEEKPYLCMIDKTGTYTKNLDGSIRKLYFIKYINEYTVTTPDVHGYEIDADKNIIKRLIERTVDEDGAKHHKYICSTYELEQAVLDPLGNLKQKIDFGSVTEKPLKELAEGIYVYGYKTKKDYYHNGEEFYYAGERRFINTHFNNQIVKFSDGSMCNLGEFGDRLESYNDGYILGHNDSMKKEHYCSFVKINGLIARYAKDFEGNELKELYSMEKVSDDYLAIKWDKRSPYYIVNRNFEYLKDAHGEKVSAEFAPYFTNGMFLIFDMNQQERESWNFRNTKGERIYDHYLFSQDMQLTKAYFEDGTQVGETLVELPQHMAEAVELAKKVIVGFL